MKKETRIYPVPLHPMAVSPNTTGIQEANILALLAHEHACPIPKDFAWAETMAWYNGRERGACIVVRSIDPGPALVIVFTEHRNCDAVVIRQWQMEPSSIPMNSIGCEHMPDTAYAQEVETPPYNAGAAADKIREIMGLWYRERLAAKRKADEKAAGKDARKRGRR